VSFLDNPQALPGFVLPQKLTVRFATLFQTDRLEPDDNSLQIGGSETMKALTIKEERGFYYRWFVCVIIIRTAMCIHQTG